MPTFPFPVAGRRAGFIFVGRDAVAVEAVGAAVSGLDPRKVPIVRHAMKRGLGKGDISRIDVVGNLMEDIRERIKWAN